MVNDKIEVFLTSDTDTVHWGEKVGHALAGRGIVYLYGELGAGKTTFCRGILRSYAYLGSVKSPTYTIIEPYELASARIFHFDLYRLMQADEWHNLGAEAYFSGQAICLVEWPQRAAEYLPPGDLAITLVYAQEGRKMEIKALSDYGRKIVKALS